MPRTPPVLAGAYVVVKLEVWPTARVKGNKSPLTLKPAPFTTLFVTVKLAVPLLVMVTDCELLPPTGTLWKYTGEGVAVSCSFTPLPESETLVGAVDALVTTESVPVALPALAGANTVWKEDFCPDATVSGNCRPLTLKPAPVTAAPETVRSAVPELVTVIVAADCAPVGTSPNFTVIGATAAFGTPPAGDAG